MRQDGLVRITVAVVLCLSASGWAQRRSRVQPAYLPEGTQIQVRIIEDLSSAKAQPGDAFHGTLYEPIFVNGREVFPKGADVLGGVVATHPSGRLSDPGILSLEVTEISYRGRTTAVRVEPFTIKGESHTKSNVTKIGGGAALGAVIGAIAGGGKGAAIGAGVGAAAGTGVAAASGKKEASVESEAVLTFVVAASSPQPELERRTDVRTSEDYSADDSLHRFSLRDQRVIRTCFAENASSLPPGLAKRQQLPPGLARQMERNQTLPPGLQKRVRPMPMVCERRLPRLPVDLERVVFSTRVMLIDRQGRILDHFDIDVR